MPPVPGSSSSAPRRCPRPDFRYTTCGCDCCDQCSSSGQQGGVSVPNGDALLRVPALQFGRFGRAPAPGLDGLSLGYSNRWLVAGTPSSPNFGFGNNFMGWPYLCEDEDQSVVVTLSSGEAVWFDEVSGGYVPQFGAMQELTHDPMSNTFTLRDPTTGSEHTFHDFNGGGANGGKLVSASSPGSPALTVEAYTPSGNIKELKREYTDSSTMPAVTTVEKVVLEFQAASGDLPEMVNRITQLRSVNNEPAAVVQETLLYYCGVGDANGNPGDLKNMAVCRPQGANMTPIESQSFRYHKGSGVPAGLVKYRLGPEATRRLLADPAGVTPETASDTLWEKYADAHYTYDAQQRVVQSTVAGGARTYTYAYTPSTNTFDYNHWYMKTVVTRPDGVTQTVFTNHIQQVLVDQLGNPGWINYRLYDGLDAMEIQHAHPSAVLSYDESQPNLNVQLRANAGLIELKQYYANTAGGGVQGYLQSESLKQGSAGTPILQKSLEYARVSAGGATVTPISKVTVYRDDAATQPIVTTLAHTYHAGTTAVQEMVNTLPVVAAGQNGDGLAYTTTQLYDLIGYPTWRKDERGFITYQKFNPVTGALEQSIQDVNMASMAGVPNAPAWVTPPGGGLHLVTDYEADAQGRTTQVLGPVHNVNGQSLRTAQWTVFKDADDEVWSAQGFATGGPTSGAYVYTLVNPVSIARQDDAGRTVDSLVAVRRAPAATGDPRNAEFLESPGRLSPSDSFPQSTWVRWSHNTYNNTGDMTASRVYHLIPATGEGLPGENYNETLFAYDSLGRRFRTQTPGGTISLNTFDARGLTLAAYVGTNDSVPVSATPWQNPKSPFDVTDNGTVSNLDVLTIAGAINNGGERLLPNPPIAPNVPPPYLDVNGDGWLTNADGQAVIDYIAQNGSGPVGPGGSIPVSNYNMLLVSLNEYDGGSQGGDGNLTQVTQFVNAEAANNRVTAFGYDFRNRRTFTNGEVDFYEEYAYDNLNQTIRVDRKHTTAGGLLIARGETLFDDRGRVYRTLRYEVNPATGAVGNALAENSFFDGAGNVLEQRSASAPDAWTKTAYDGLGRTTRTLVGYTDGGDRVFEQSQPTYDPAGNVIQSLSLQRFHDDSTTVGPLTANTNARPMFAAAWFDGLGRTLATAAYGTNGGANFVRPAAQPSGNDLLLVSTVAYNAAGEAFETADPKGIQSRTEFDHAGRVVRTLQNFVPGSTASDANITIETTYTADGRQATLTAVNASTGNQTTQYIYGVTVANGSDLYSNDLLREVVYPDGHLDRVRYAYNRQGQTTRMVDQNGTVHAYTFDKLGRQLTDNTTALGLGIDAAARKISRTYEVRGLVEKITTFNEGGGVVNEVKNAYNGLAQLVTQSQSHAGAVGMGTPAVNYAYDLTAAGGVFTNGARPTNITYPNGRVISLAYLGTDGDNLARVNALQEGGLSHVAYSYLGLGAFVVTDYPQPDVKLDYTAAAAGDAKYPGFDRFNRVVDHRWVGYGANPGDRDRFKYGYDRNSNRLYRENLTAQALGQPFDELYAYDRVNRLVDFKRGTLSGDKRSINGTPTKAQTWGLDQTGNWPRFTSATDGTPETDQVREHNQANEITQLSGWFPTRYDEAGNLTRMPKPAEPTEGFAATYDAWNRLVRIREVDECGCPSDTVAEFQYDGQNWRTLKVVGGESRHFYYSSNWQVLEERLGGSTNPDRQFVWGRRYIDDLILRDRDTNGDGTLDERLFATQDANWNVTALVNPSGIISERYAYEPYGKPSFLAVQYSIANASQFEWEWLFATYLHDAETELFISRRRYFSHLLGVWISRDPRSYFAGIGLTRYVSSRPTMFTDPTGLFQYDANGTYFQFLFHGVLLGPGDVIINTMFGTIPIVSRNLQNTYDRDYFRASCVLRKLGLELPNSDNGVYWGRISGGDGYTLIVPAFPFGLNRLTYCVISDNFRNADMNSAAFQELLVTLYHEIKGHATDLSTHDNATEQVTFDALYEQPVYDAIDAAEANKTWATILCECAPQDEILRKAQRSHGPR